MRASFSAHPRSTAGVSSVEPSLTQMISRSSQVCRCLLYTSIIAFIWAAAALTFYGSPEALGAATANGKAPALAIQMISESWMGHVGSILVMVGVVILPISTGDGALRVTRLMIADCFKLNQEQLSRRLMIAIPLFAAAIAVSSMDYALSLIHIYP